MTMIHFLWKCKHLYSVATCMCKKHVEDITPKYNDLVKSFWKYYCIFFSREAVLFFKSFCYNMLSNDCWNKTKKAED